MSGRPAVALGSIVRIFLVGLSAAAALVALAVAAAPAEGAEYWAATLPGNLGVEPSTLALSNRDAAPQVATVEDAAGVAAAVAVAPGQTSVWQMDPRPMGSSLSNQGIYRVDADDAVAAAQFAPIAHAFSNDATGLYDTRYAGGEFYVTSYLQSGVGSSYATVIALQNGTTVQVTPTSNVAAGAGVPAIPAGTTSTFTLDRFDALTLTSSADLAGSHILARQPLVGFAGATCTNVGASSCDHLENQMIPINQAGLEHLLCSTGEFRTGEYDRVRVTATTPGPTLVTPDPPVAGGPFTLAAAGASRDFDITSDSVITSDAPVLVTQLLGFGNSVPPLTDPHGDPAMINHLTVAKHLPEHILFNPPETWVDTLTVGTRAGTNVQLDGAAVTGWRTVGASNHRCATVQVADGTHTVTGDAPISVQALGLEYDSSYWYLSDGRFTPPPVCPQIGSAPGAPQNVQGSQNGSKGTLGWQAPASDGGCPIDGYRVYRLVNGTWTLEATVPSKDRSAEVFLPTICEPYEYAVSASNSVGEGPRSPPVTLRHDPDRCEPSDVCPALHPLASVQLRVGQPWQVHVTGHDPDGDPYVIEAVRLPLPSAAAWDPESHVLAWTPGPGSQGSYGPVTFQITTPADAHPAVEPGQPAPDPSSCRDTESFSITVFAEPDPPGNSDRDSDGVFDAHDNCPGASNRDQADHDGNGVGDACSGGPPAPGNEGPEAPADPPPADPCRTALRVRDVQAAVAGDDAVVRWNGSGCQGDRFLVFNGTDLVGVVQHDPAQVAYALTVRGLWPVTHRYHVQAAAAGEPDRFDAVRAVPSNWLRFDAGEDPDGPSGGHEAERPDTRSDGGGPDGGLAAAWAWWTVAAFLAVLAAVALAAVWRRRRGSETDRTQRPA